jgi:4-diphosphocytidyl-2-C-methyl-D-erythritol kinase
MITEIAPAKINLYLHVGALRPDRLHELASLFVFADGGDVLTVEPAKDLSLEISGAFGGALARENVERNLVMKAARALQRRANITAGARMRLDKRLPIASGVGGGSADAAAALRALMRLWQAPLGAHDLRRLAFSLGADVPACLDRTPVEVTGAGETLAQGPTLPPLWICLCNPRTPMPTGPVFRDFDRTNPAPVRPAVIRPPTADYEGVRRLFVNSRNDLEAIAIRRRRVVQDVLNCMARRPGLIGTRMSGSGATILGLFTSQQAARRAATDMSSKGWWSMSARIFTHASRREN